MTNDSTLLDVVPFSVFKSYLPIFHISSTSSFRKPIPFPFPSKSCSSTYSLPLNLLSYHNLILLSRWEWADRLIRHNWLSSGDDLWQIGDLFPLTPVLGTERVTALRVLGVIISSRLTMGQDLDQLISSCTSYIFVLRTLKSRGLRPSQLHQVVKVTTVASLLYASFDLVSLATTDNKSRKERLLEWWRRGGY